MRYFWLTLALAAHPAAAQDVTVDYLGRDFSQVLKPKTPFLGFIGPDYQKLDVVLLSVTRDPAVAGNYFVTGYVLLKGRQTAFSGSVVAERIEQLGHMHLGADKVFKGRVKTEGVFHGFYLFREDDGSKLKGTMTLNWYVDAKGRLAYDDIERTSHTYRNNQYIGQWSLGSDTLTANWGEYRIPDSGDLDIGAGEFAANPRYKTSGW